MSVDELEAEFLKLPEDQQQAFIGRINQALDPIDPAVRDVWDAEISRWVQDIKEGRVVCRDAEEVEAEIEAELNARG